MVSIGHGTTEYLVVDDRKPSHGRTDVKAANYLIAEIDQTGAGYVKTDIFKSNEVREALPLLVEYIDNNCKKLQLRATKNYELLFSGGSVLIPGLKEAMEKRGMQFKIAEEPVFSNAIGMHMLAHEKIKALKRDNTDDISGV